MKSRCPRSNRPVGAHSLFKSNQPKNMKATMIILPLLMALAATAAPPTGNPLPAKPGSPPTVAPDPVLLPPQNLVASAEPKPIPGQPNQPQKPGQVPGNKFLPAHTNYYTDPPEKFPPALTNRPPWPTNQPSWPTNRPPWFTNQPAWPTNHPSWSTNRPAWPTNRPHWNTNQSPAIHGA